MLKITKNKNSNSIWHFQSYTFLYEPPVPDLHHSNYHKNASTVEFTAAPRRRWRTGPGSHRVRKHRLPPPPFTGVARATAARSLGRPGRRCHCSRSLLQALVLGAPLSSSLHILHALHALCSPLRSHFCSVRHCCTWSRLAQVRIRQLCTRILKGKFMLAASGFFGLLFAKFLDDFCSFRLRDWNSIILAGLRL